MPVWSLPVKHDKGLGKDGRINFKTSNFFSPLGKVIKTIFLPGSKRNTCLVYHCIPNDCQRVLRKIGIHSINTWLVSNIVACVSV